MDRKARYLIIDDNELDRLTIHALAARHPFLELVGTAANALDGVHLIRTMKPDVLFADVEMPGLSGIDVLRATKGVVPVNVLVTSHPEFALEGFELAVLDYVLKPMTPERFAETARRISELLNLQEKATAYEVAFEKEVLTIKEGHDTVRVPIHEIVYLEAMNNYTKIVTAKGRHLVLATLTSFAEALPEGKFIRVHRSYMVARDKVTRVHAGELHLPNNVHVPVGRKYRQALQQWEA